MCQPLWGLGVARKGDAILHPSRELGGGGFRWPGLSHCPHCVQMAYRSFASKFLFIPSSNSLGEEYWPILQIRKRKPEVVKWAQPR